MGSAAATVRQAVDLQRSGRIDEARGLYRQILDRDPNCPIELTHASVAAFECGAADLAEAMLRSAIELDPSNSEAVYNLGVVHLRTNAWADAVESFRRASELRPGHAESHINLGCALLQLNWIGEAVAAFERAVEVAPRHPEAWSNLGLALHARGDSERAARACETALRHDPANSGAHANYGVALMELGRFGEAARAFQSALRHAPGDLATLSNLGVALQKSGRPDDAIKIFQHASRMPGSSSELAFNLCDAAIALGAPKRALEECERALDRFPGDTRMLAMKAMSLCECGATGSADRLIDYDGHLMVDPLGPPSGYTDGVAFDAALVDQILAHPTLTHQPGRHATRNGLHSGDLAVGADGAIGAFIEAVNDRIGGYIRALPPEPEHPFRCARPGNWTLRMWSIVLREGGHQISHIHPDAWLSGVYYPLVPDAIREDDAARQGWIEFGRPPDDVSCRACPELRIIRPERGMLILFPSFYFHRTIPMRTDDTRISIAFDVEPV